jgi:potassium-transporting ATPase KdpC subunit
MLKELRQAVLLVFAVGTLAGVAYPLALTGLARLVSPYTASGSIIERDGKPVGSELIGQNFTRPGYFHPRPSATSYDTLASSGANAAPSSASLIARVRQRTEAARAEIGQRQIPIDMVTSSASGLDPHISPASAYSQAPRVAAARNMEEGDLWKLIARFVEPRTFNMLGEPRVNVLKLNLALDAMPREPAAPPR